MTQFLTTSPSSSPASTNAPVNFVEELKRMRLLFLEFAGLSMDMYGYYENFKHKPRHTLVDFELTADFVDADYSLYRILEAAAASLEEDRKMKSKGVTTPQALALSVRPNSSFFANLWSTNTILCGYIETLQKCLKGKHDTAKVLEEMVQLKTYSFELFDYALKNAGIGEAIYRELIARGNAVIDIVHAAEKMEDAFAGANLPCQSQTLVTKGCHL